MSSAADRAAGCAPSRAPRIAARLEHRLAVTGADVGLLALRLDIDRRAADADVGGRGCELPAAAAEDDSTAP